MTLAVTGKCRALHRNEVRVILVVVTSDYGSRRTLRRVRPRRGGLIMLNAVGWAALIALGSTVSALASLLLPLPVALGLGVIVSSTAYAAEWLMTRRDMNQSGVGPRPPGGGLSGVREPRRPAPPMPALGASRSTPQ